MTMGSDTIQQNIKARQQADELTQFVRDQVARFTSHGAAIFWESMRDDAAKWLPVLRPLPAEPTKQDPVAEAIAQVERIADLADEVESDEGQDYSESACTTATEIGETIKRTKRVTENQQLALDNIEAGINAWLRREG